MSSGKAGASLLAGLVATAFGGVAFLLACLLTFAALYALALAGPAAALIALLLAGPMATVYSVGAALLGVTVFDAVRSKLIPRHETPRSYTA